MAKTGITEHGPFKVPTFYQLLKEFLPATSTADHEMVPNCVLLDTDSKAKVCSLIISSGE